MLLQNIFGAPYIPRPKGFSIRFYGKPDKNVNAYRAL
jgi:hypothetical protein